MKIFFTLLFFVLCATLGVAQQEDCLSPSNIKITNITAYTVSVNWDSVHNATEYEVHYRKIGTGDVYTYR